MKNIPLFLLLLLLPIIASAQKYVGTYYGGALGISNVPPNIATNGGTAASGTIFQKTGDKVQATDTVTNLNIRTAIVGQVYAPYTNLAGWFDSTGQLLGTNTLRLATNWISGPGSDLVMTSDGGRAYFSQSAGGTFNFGQGTVPGLTDGHVVAQDFTGNVVGGGQFTRHWNGGGFALTNVSVVSGTADISAGLSGLHLASFGTVGIGKTPDNYGQGSVHALGNFVTDSGNAIIGGSVSSGGSSYLGVGNRLILRGSAGGVGNLTDGTITTAGTGAGAIIGLLSTINTNSVWIPTNSAPTSVTIGVTAPDRWMILKDLQGNTWYAPAWTNH